MEYYSILFIIIILFAIRKERILDFSSFLLVNILYVICYGLVPLVIFLVEVPSYYNGPLGNLPFNPEQNGHLYFNASTLAIISYTFFFFGYKIVRFKNKILFNSFFSTNNINKLINISKWLFFSGTLILFLYIMLYGSISNMLLSNKRMAYGGDAEVEIESPFLFLIILAKIVIFTAYMFWGLKKITNKNIKLFFYASIIVSIFILFRFSGRMIFMTFIAVFPLTSFILKQKLPKLKFMILAAFAGFMILFGNAIFRSVLYEDSFERRQEYYSNSDIILTPFLDIVGGFSFPYRNLLHYYDHESYYYFIDLLQFPLYILPRKIVPISPATTTIEANTMHILGVPGGIMPPDIVTYGLLNFGFFGVVLVAFIFGTLCKYIDSYQRKGAPALSVIITLALVFIVGFRVMYFNPKQLITGYFYFFICLFIFRWLKPTIRLKARKYKSKYIINE